MTPPKLDIDILDELRSEFGVDILVELLRMAKASAETELDELSRQIDAGSSLKTRRIAHSLVGILGQYGAMEASRLARETQHADDAELFAQAAALVEAGREALTELRRYADEAEPVKTKVA
ncbi:MAG: Hpt domain-containing protein [Beijerinckiaceae bacterium]|nr:Hpt domain-containing protein [Beijerinckiaceae bacterium]